MRVLQPGAIEAALTGEKLDRDTKQQGRRALELELEAARFEAQRAFRQYDAIDPENRIVARELERRWNIALVKLGEPEERWTKLKEDGARREPCTEEDLLKLAAEFQDVWTDSTTDMAIKKRIVRCLIQEIVVTRNDKDRMVRAIIHWTGGVHTELTVPLFRPGETRRQTTREASEIIKELAAVLPDDKIARVMGRLGQKTSTGLTWTRARISYFRKEHGIPAHSRHENGETIFDLTHAAMYAKVSPMTTHRLLNSGQLQGRQPAPYAPWLIKKEDLDRFLEKPQSNPEGDCPSLSGSAKQQTLDFS